ncbi:alpha/beta fold hydrolase [Methanobacterium petrolearium]|uniref:alpha/beta fold hydrolase n=1 Tax=Methanobacterium petrolearium TaxID=710190 RepID=UPI001AE2391F|nr:alpha/beta hydrolase [Methanobacterium petrolearium]MBP1946291.1 3-oxoadipate enol-lactonase [Methanobacterium petrolearium]
MVLVHGLGSDHTVWGGLTPLLEENFRVLAVDLRGHGRSSKTPEQYSIELFSNDINQLLESLNIKQAHFIGHSMGGAILQQLALKRPDKIRSLILISSFSCVDFHLDSIFRELLKTLNDEGYNAFFDHCLKLANTPEFIAKNREFFREVRDLMGKTSSIPALKESIKACQQVNFIGSLKNVNSPTLIIAGREDVFTPLYHANKIKNAIPNSKMEVMEGVGHNLLVENPQDTYDLIYKFLKNF